MLKIAASDFEYPPLAAHVADEMEARNWTCVDVAKRMPGDYGHNVGVMNFFLAIDPEKLLITDELISGLSEAFEVSEQFFRNLHSTWLDNPDCRSAFNCPEHLLDGLVFPSNDNPHE